MTSTYTPSANQTLLSKSKVIPDQIVKTGKNKYFDAVDIVINDAEKEALTLTVNPRKKFT